MILALIVAVAWCPTTTMTGAVPERPSCPCPTTTSTGPSETIPDPIIHQDPFPPTTTTTTTTAPPTTTTAAPMIVDAATAHRPAQLPVTGAESPSWVFVAGFLLFLGGLLVVARPGRAP